MDRKKSTDLVYYVKEPSDEENKKKNKKNINYNHFQKSYQKNHQKLFLSKSIKQKPESNHTEKYKSKKSSGMVNEDSSPTKETLNSPSNNKNIIDITPKKNDKKKDRTNKKNESKKITPNEKYKEENKKEIISKFNTFESIPKNEDDNENEDDLVTSFERKPSELKSPHTISEDSFTSSYEEKKSKKGANILNEKLQKNDEINSNNLKKELIKKDSHTYSELDENELIYVDRISYTKDEEEKIIDIDEKDFKNNKKRQINNIKIPELNLKEKNLAEKEKERENKNEKFKNIEIKTKTTTRQTTYINACIPKNNTNNKTSDKIIVNKSPREFLMKTERECPSSNLVIISKKSLNDKMPYIPVNQRKKLTVNKKQINSYKIKDSAKANSLNINESNLSNININNSKEKIFLSNFKKSENKFFGQMKTYTEEKNRYKKKYINKNSSKENFFNTNLNKINLDNIKVNKGCLSNRKQKDSKQLFDNNLNDKVTRTIEIKDEYTHNKKRNKMEKEKEKSENNNELCPKKNTVLLTKSTNNNRNNKTQSVNNICKKDSYYSNKNKIVYEHKKLGVIRVRSSEKVGNPPIYNNMSYDPNKYLEHKIKDALYKENKNKLNNLSNENMPFNNINNNINYTEINNSENIQKKYIELNNSFNNIEFLNKTMFNNINASNNFNSTLNQNQHYDNDTNQNLRYTNYMLNNNTNKIIGDSLFLNKMTEKTNSASNLTNLLNPKEKYLLNNYNDRSTQNNNILLNNLHQNALFHNNSSYDIGLNESMKFLNNRTQLINLIGNNFLGPNILQNNPSNNLNNTIGSFNNISNVNLQSILPNGFNINNNIEQNISLSINFEDLIILQEYLRDIIVSLEKNKIIENECFEYWNYYYNSSICCQLEKLFTNALDSNAVRISINYNLMSIMLCYDYSFQMNLMNKTYMTLSDILKLNYKNLMLICEYILGKITKESLSNIWVLKLSTIVNASNYNDYNQFLLNGYNMTIIERISYNTNIIVQHLRFLLKNFKTDKNDILISMFKKIREKTYEEINSFFRENILRITNINGSILGSVLLLKNNNFRTLPSPYVRTKNNKEFSLVLDLDETLINFKPKNNGEEGGVLRVRPGINEFLDEVGKYYELIIFTTATQDYADALIDAVEEDKIYFDHRLYREHAIINGNDFVKDLTRIGRPLDKIIIVDNMPQNFRLQKENGIIIKAFWGEDSFDTALCDLYPILVNIAKEGGDVRKSLIKYKDEIVKKVTSCISKSDL